MQRSMQRVVAFFSETRQRLRSGRASAQPATATTASTAYELQEENLGRLHRAAAHGDLAWLRRWRWWLKRVGIDQRDKEKRTPLHLACANGHVDVVKYLVQKNCQLNLADSFGRSPLMKAVQCQQEECVAILLEHGADPNLADADGNAALHLAVLSLNTTVAGLLLEHNANIDAQNQDGYTPLNLAVSRHLEEMVEFLQKKGADRHAQDQHESELPVQNMDGENMEEPPAGGAEDKAVLGTSCPMRTADKAALAQDTGGAQPVGGVEQEHDAEFPEDFEACTRLQQELADALKKQAMSEALLEVTTHCTSVLEEDKLWLQKELDTAKAEIRELEEQKLQSEHCVHDLETDLDNKEREVVASSQKLQDFLLASFGTNAAIKKLEEHVQRLEIENARLDATVQQQSSRTEALQRDLQASAWMQKQNVLGLTSKGLHSMLEEVLQLTAHAKEHVDQSDREKAELLEQHDSEAQQVLKLVEGICRDTVRVCKELEINLKLEKDCERMKTQLHGAMRNGRVYEERETESKINSEETMKTNCSETASEGDGLRKKHCSQTIAENTTLHQLPRRRKKPATAEPRTEAFMVGDLSQQLEKKSKKCMQLKAQNRDLQEQLSTMQENHEKLEKSKCQLEEEVAKLKHHMETNMVDRSQTEQYKREIEEQAAQGKIHEMQKVNLVLQLGDLSQQLEKESKKCMQLEAQNRDLQEQLSTMHENHEKLEKSKCQLEEEVAKLKYHTETNMVDRSQTEQYKREIEEQAAQGKIHEMQKVNLILQLGDLSQQLEKESKKCMQLEAQNHDLQEQLSTMHENHEKLEKSKCQLEEEVAKLKHHLESNLGDHSQIDQYKIEEQATQGRRQKLDEAYLVFPWLKVHYLLQTQAVSQDRLEQIRGTVYDIRHKLRDLQCEMDNMQNSHLDGIPQQKSLHVELKRYKELYLKEVNFRKSLGNKLERANERLAEANAKLLQERCRNRLPSTSSNGSEDLAESPVQYSTELGHLGNSLTLNPSLCLGRTIRNMTWTSVSPINGEEAYVENTVTQTEVLRPASLVLSSPPSRPRSLLQDIAERYIKNIRKV